MNWIEWYRIVAYAGVDGVPRHVLVAHADEDAFWILDARADEGRPSIYTIHDAGRSLDEATARFAQHARDAEALPASGCIPVEHVQFDATLRAALKLTSPPIT